MYIYLYYHVTITIKFLRPHGRRHTKPDVFDSVLRGNPLQFALEKI